MSPIDRKIESRLKKENEGYVFAHVYMQNIQGRAFFVCRDYYVVLNGIVHIIEDEKLTESGDTVFNLTVDCLKVGKYNPKYKYRQTAKEYTYREIIKKHNL